MTIYELKPMNGRAHRKAIREMTRESFWVGCMPMNPQLAALIDVACGAVAASVAIAAIRLLIWRLTGI